MRVFAVLVLLFAGCDFQPPNRDKLASSATPPRPPPTPAIRVEPGSAAPTPAPPVRPKAPLMETSAECEKVAVHVTNIVIASITDPALKAAQEQDRTKLVRKVSETCTKDKWNAAAQKCFLDGKTAPELETCGRSLAAPKPDAPKPDAPKPDAPGHEGHGH